MEEYIQTHCMRAVDRSKTVLNQKAFEGDHQNSPDPKNEWHL